MSNSVALCVCVCVQVCIFESVYVLYENVCVCWHVFDLPGKKAVYVDLCNKYNKTSLIMTSHACNWLSETSL